MDSSIQLSSIQLKYNENDWNERKRVLWANIMQWVAVALWVRMYIYWEWEREKLLQWLAMKIDLWFFSSFQLIGIFREIIIAISGSAVFYWLTSVADWLPLWALVSLKYHLLKISDYLHNNANLNLCGTRRHIRISSAKPILQWENEFHGNAHC